jgi:protein-S-isoprenylcysteine O-methyltransferase Ste14
MSLIPAFELGLWNAWIFILPLVIISIFGVRLFGKRVSGENSVPTRREKIDFACMHLIVIASYAYSVFLPLKLGTLWFYIGLLIYLSGMLITIVAVLNFATTSVDKPVTKGVYTFSRSPMYIGESLINISISIACVSWIFLLVAVVVAILEQNIVVSEEHFCLKKYGDAYRKYMNRTPRWIGIPKSKNRLRKTSPL